MGFPYSFQVVWLGALQNYNAYMTLDLSAFEGLWIAIFNGNVVAHGPDPKKVYTEAMELSNNKKVMLTKIPKRGVIEIL